MSSPFLRKYNTLLATATTAIRIPMVKAGANDFAVAADWTPAAGDVKVSINSGSLANITNLPTYVNGAWEFILTAAELSSKTTTVTIVDSATKAVEDQFFSVETFGNASAMYQYDPQDAVRMGLTALPNAAADGAGGLPISDAGGLDLDSIKTDTSAILIDTGTTLDGRIPAALVGGRMDSSVGAVAANAITAASIATDAIDADAVAANAVTKIQSGLALDATVAKDATVSKPGTAQTISSNADITAIKAKTDNLPASPAAVGSAMTLADDAITAGKFDETTAFPLASADAAATAVARTGADADTLATLSGQLDGVQTSVGTVDGIVDAILVDTAAIDARLPSDPADESLLEAAIVTRSSQTSVDTLAGYVDTEVAAIKAKTDNLPSDPADQSALEALIDALPTAAENAAAVWGATTRTLSAGAIVAATFAANALDAVWSVASRTLSAFGFTVATNSDSNVTAIKAKTDNLPASPAAVGSAMTLATDAVNAAALAADAVAEIQSGLSTLNAAGVRSAIGLASANLDTQLDALPTAAENRAEMDSNSTKLANLDASVSSRGTADPGDAMTLTAAYDAAKTAASAANLAIVDGIVDDILVDTAAIDLRLPVSPAAVGSAMTLSSGERLAVADSVWDELLAGHSLAGSAGLALSNAGGALDAAGTAAAVWGALRATYGGAGTFGEYTRASLERVAGSATVDTLTITAWFETILAHAAGDVVRSVNTYDYKKQDGVTTAFSFTSSAGGRS